MARDDPELRFRAPKEVKDWLRTVARTSRRSLNGEIVFRLEAAMIADLKAEAPAVGNASQA